MNEIQQEMIKNYPQFYIINNRTWTFITERTKYILTFIFLQLYITMYSILVARHFQIIIIIFTIGFHIVVSIIMGLLIFKDPAIIPKIAFKRSQKQGKIPFDDKLVRNNFGVLNEYTYKKYVSQLNNVILSIVFCSQCCIYRPPRTVHCHICDVCIQKMDHHCPWLGVCIGKGNYKYYLCFLAFLLALFIIVHYQLICLIHGNDMNRTVVELILGIILCTHIFEIVIIIVPLFIFVFFLFSFHCFIASSNITTYEFLHKKWQQISGNPFQKSFFIKNIVKMIKRCYQSNLQSQKNAQNKYLQQRQTNNFKSTDYICTTQNNHKIDAYSNPSQLYFNSLLNSNTKQ